MALTTTWALIRAGQVTALRTLTPAAISSVPFAVHDGETPFEDWCEINPEASLRRYSIDMESLEDEGAVRDLDTILVRLVARLTVAYPSRSLALYGAGNRYALQETIVTDHRQIAEAIGISGQANYVSGQQLCDVEALDPLEEGPSVTLARCRMTVIYQEAP